MLRFATLLLGRIGISFRKTARSTIDIFWEIVSKSKSEGGLGIIQTNRRWG